MDYDQRECPVDRLALWRCHRVSSRDFGISLEPLTPILSQSAYGILENEKSATFCRRNAERICQFAPRPALNMVSFGTDERFCKPRSGCDAVWTSVGLEAGFGDPVVDDSGRDGKFSALVASACAANDDIGSRYERSYIARAFEVLDDERAVVGILHRGEISHADAQMRTSRSRATESLREQSSLRQRRRRLRSRNVPS
jgi:hypothetical protein